MDQVIQMVKERAGIDEAQARKATETVVGFLKDKLPDPMAGQIDKVVGGGGSDAGAGSPMDRVSGMFGTGDSG